MKTLEEKVNDLERRINGMHDAIADSFAEVSDDVNNLYDMAAECYEALGKSIPSEEEQCNEHSKSWNDEQSESQSDEDKDFDFMEAIDKLNWVFNDISDNCPLTKREARALVEYARIWIDSVDKWCDERED